jgi:hypothetical protein
MEPTPEQDFFRMPVVAPGLRALYDGFSPENYDEVNCDETNDLLPDGFDACCAARLGLGG